MNIQIALELRPCIVKGKKALFHQWSEIAQIREAFMIGSTGGQLKQTVGIIEYKDGTVQFIYDETFSDLADLQAKLSGWVWWYNNERLHSSLGYKTPIESRQSYEIGVTDEKIVNKKYQNFWKKVSIHGQKVEISN